jgi:ASC-1-like (ASCH) protein
MPSDYDSDNEDNIGEVLFGIIGVFVYICYTRSWYKCSCCRKHVKNDNVIDGQDYQKLHVQEPWLSKIINGEKTVEGRKGSIEKFKDFIGNVITLYNENKSIQVYVHSIRHYPTLLEYLNVEGFAKVLPGVKDIGEAIDVYHKFYADEQIKEAGGMCALEFTIVH